MFQCYLMVFWCCVASLVVFSMLFDLLLIFFDPLSFTKVFPMQPNNPQSFRNYIQHFLNFSQCNLTSPNMSSTMLDVFLALLSSLEIFFMSPHCLKNNFNHVPSSVFPTLVTCPLCHSTLPNTLGIHWHLFDIPLLPKNKNTNKNKILMSLDIFLMLPDTPQCLFDAPIVPTIT